MPARRRQRSSLAGVLATITASGLSSLAVSTTPDSSNGTVSDGALARAVIDGAVESARSS